MTPPRLSVELVPKTCFFSNVRSAVSQGEWDIIRRATYKAASYVCGVCGGKGPKHPVEAHEVWHYNDERKIQKLVGMIALCPSCHGVKHFGFSSTRGFHEVTLRHLMKVNSWSRSEAQVYIEAAFDLWKDRSRSEWDLDISFLTRYGLGADQLAGMAATATRRRR